VLLASYVRYCPGGSFHFTAYSPKCLEGGDSETPISPSRMLPCTTRSTKGFEIEFRALLAEETLEVELALIYSKLHCY
jgi:hypothetical protein